MFFLSPSWQSWDVQSVFDYYIINKITTSNLQKRTASTNFVNEVFYEAKGMNIMDSILSNFKEDTLFRGNFSYSQNNMW